MTRAELRLTYVRWAREEIETVDLLDAVAKFFREPLRCRLCHGKRTINAEGAQGWDEPCPKCAA